jgi:hypothetical protein
MSTESDESVTIKPWNRSYFIVIDKDTEKKDRDAVLYKQANVTDPLFPLAVELYRHGVSHLATPIHVKSNTRGTRFGSTAFMNMAVEDSVAGLLRNDPLILQWSIMHYGQHLAAPDDVVKALLTHVATTVYGSVAAGVPDYANMRKLALGGINLLD